MKASDSNGLYNTSNRLGFTLIELLIVIAIIAILAVVVVLVLNPAELLKESRDANRLSDVATMTNAINLYNTDQNGTPNFSLGNASSVYVSLLDSSSTCGDQELPTPPSGYSYFCGSSTSSRNIDGTGWVPIDFKTISSGSPIGSLPLDPVNQSSTGLYYTYATDGSHFEVTSLFESQKYKANQEKNPPDALYPELDAQGSSLTVNPLYNSGGLVGWWPLNEGTGTVAYDQSGNGNNGTWSGSLINGSHYMSGKVGSYAGNFDGSTDYVSSAIEPLYETSATQFSITFWSNATIANLSSTYKSVYVNADDSASYTSGVAIYLDGRTNPNGLTGSNLFVVGYGKASGAYIAATSNSIPNTGGWHFYAYADNGTDNFYIDGSPVSSQLSSSFDPTGNFVPSSRILNIGHSQASGGFFSNGLSDVRIYNRALSPAEVQAIYNAEN